MVLMSDSIAVFHLVKSFLPRRPPPPLLEFVPGRCWMAFTFPSVGIIRLLSSSPSTPPPNFHMAFLLENEIFWWGGLLNLRLFYSHLILVLSSSQRDSNSL